MKYILAKELYPKAVVLKAAYQFTDIAYIFIEQDDKSYIISFDLKNGSDEIAEQDFKNELLLQAVRQVISQETKDIRTLVAARAMASTIIHKPSQAKRDVPNDKGLFSTDKILKDWFDNEKGPN